MSDQDKQVDTRKSWPPPVDRPITSMDLTVFNGKVDNCRDKTCPETYAHNGPCRSYTAKKEETELTMEIRHLREALRNVQIHHETGGYH